jgi:hypothetical protein
MWKKLIAGGLAVGVLALAVWIGILTFVPPALDAAAGERDACARFGIGFDASSIEAIYRHPERILADADAFWAEDGAYQVAAEWYRARGLPVPLEDWQRRLERVAALSPEAREGQQPYRIARAVMSGREAFCARAVPHVLSFLPDGTELGTSIYLTALTDAYVPYQHPRMAVDTSHSSHIVATGLVSLPRQVLRQPTGSWAEMRARGSASTIYNTLVHELFHAGYWSRTPQPEGVPTATYEALVALQNEGLAVYVAYLAEPGFPAPLENDYRGGPSAVRGQIRDLNAVFAAADSMPREELWRRFVEVGFGQKAFHQVGSAMAQAIDQELGREALVATILAGPASFVQAYNAVAEETVQLPAGYLEGAD